MSGAVVAFSTAHVFYSNQRLAGADPRTRLSGRVALSLAIRLRVEARIRQLEISKNIEIYGGTPK
jgi:hypothetical protein